MDEEGIDGDESTSAIPRPTGKVATTTKNEVDSTTAEAIEKVSGNSPEWIGNAHIPSLHRRQSHEDHPMPAVQERGPWAIHSHVETEEDRDAPNVHASVVSKIGHAEPRRRKVGNWQTLKPKRTAIIFIRKHVRVVDAVKVVDEGLADPSHATVTVTDTDGVDEHNRIHRRKGATKADHGNAD